MAEQFVTRNRAVHDALRACTQKIHKRLHRHLGFAGLFHQASACVGYREVMRALYGFPSSIEIVVEDKLKNPASVADRNRHTSRSARGPQTRGAVA